MLSDLLLEAGLWVLCAQHVIAFVHHCVILELLHLAATKLLCLADGLWLNRVAVLVSRCVEYLPVDT